MVDITDDKINKVEKELLSKKLQVGQRIYYIDLKENSRGRFMKFVETLSMGRASRIVIPMSIADQFVQKLKEVIDFKETFVFSPKETITVDPENKFGVPVKSLVFSVLGRKFYFDIKETQQETLILRISHVSANRRVNITIFADAVSNLVQIMEDYMKLYPYQATNITTVNTEIRKKPRTKKVLKDNETIIKTIPKEVIPFKTQRLPLVISEDPSPKVYSIEGRSYTFEVVSGQDNSFLRICEQKNYRKSTLHVPLELCRKWKETLGSFVKSIPEELILTAKTVKTEQTEITA